MAKNSKAGACSSNTQAAKGNCLQHARREGNIPSYVNPHRSDLNRTVFEADTIRGRKSIVPLVKRAEKDYTAKTGQKCQKSFAPFRESVLVIREDTTDDQVRRFMADAERLTGWKCVGAWVHLDEGHAKSRYIEGSDGFAVNAHVHVLWDCIDHNTGKAIRAGRSQLSRMQDILAAATGMERGNKAEDTGRTRRSAQEQRIHAQEQRIAQLEAMAEAKSRDTRDNLIDGLASLVGGGRKARIEAMTATIEAKEAEIRRLGDDIAKKDAEIARMAKVAADAKKAANTAIREAERRHADELRNARQEQDKAVDDAREQGAKYARRLMDDHRKDIGELCAHFAPDDPRVADYYDTPRSERFFAPPWEIDRREREKRENATKTASMASDHKPQKQIAMEQNEQLEAGWAEVLDYATQHAKDEGPRKGLPWIRDAFNEYFNLHEQEVEAGRAMSLGGQSFSLHNRGVMAERIRLELGHHIGGRAIIDEAQEARLKKSLDYIVNEPQQNQGMRR